MRSDIITNNEIMQISAYVEILCAHSKRDAFNLAIRSQKDQNNEAIFQVHSGTKDKCKDEGAIVQSTEISLEITLVAPSCVGFSLKRVRLCQNWASEVLKVKIAPLVLTLTINLIQSSRIMNPFSHGRQHN